jgi:RND family efflux transporter MFP subunit
MQRFLTRFLLPAAFIGASVAGAVIMVKSAETAEAEPPVAEHPLVDVVEVSRQAHHPTVSGTGVVEAARQVSIVPEVGGRVKFQSPNLVVGGRFEQGEIMVELDDRDYRIAIRQQRNQVAQAKLELEVEQGRGNVAEREWEMLSSKDAAPDPERGRLARRQPHAQAAEVGVDAAKSGLDKARLDLARTVIKAPFGSTVVSESVEVGQVVGNASVLATLVGTDEVWARASVPVEYLRLIEVPGVHGASGPSARVVQTLRSGQQVTWEGRVIRLIHELDSDSRTAQVLVAVERPFDPGPGQLPLLPGAFVRVEFTGELVPDVVQVPRRAVVEGRFVWVVDPQGTLERRELEVAWGDEQALYATSGLAGGERIVLDPPALAIEDMPVRAQEASPPTPRTADAGDAKTKTEG